MSTPTSCFAEPRIQIANLEVWKFANLPDSDCSRTVMFDGILNHELVSPMHVIVWNVNLKKLAGFERM
jgi:hypothetical protein